ncbi:MAG: tetratricopeptide repeat protein [Lentimicrobiaceae bacterium]|nr:tetratricopeptide repeat protein [Lentimicrobiaceae bacterium]
MKRIFLSLFVALMLLSCGDKIRVKKIKKLESKVFAKGVELKEENVINLVDAYLLYAEQNPDDAKSPDFLFKALDVAVGINAEGPQKAIEVADILIEKYPDFEMTPMATYIKGFVYESVVGDLDKAKAVYLQFLEMYPDNPMAEEVRTVVDNLGIPLEELIKTFEQ